MLYNTKTYGVTSSFTELLARFELAGADSGAGFVT